MHIHAGRQPVCKDIATQRHADSHIQQRSHLRTHGQHTHPLRAGTRIHTCPVHTHTHTSTHTPAVCTNIATQVRSQLPRHTGPHRHTHTLWPGTPQGQAQALLHAHTGTHARARTHTLALCTDIATQRHSPLPTHRPRPTRPHTGKPNHQGQPHPLTTIRHTQPQALIHAHTPAVCKTIATATLTLERCP